MNTVSAVRIHPRDNVVTVVDGAVPEDRIRFLTAEGPRELSPREAIPPGHKVATVEIPAGAEVLKYAQPIGTASRLIRPGEHVHVHNVQSRVQGSSGVNR